jgi:hypothetical protein
MEYIIIFVMFLSGLAVIAGLLFFRDCFESVYNLSGMGMVYSSTIWRCSNQFGSCFWAVMFRLVVHDAYGRDES